MYIRSRRSYVNYGVEKMNYRINPEAWSSVFAVPCLVTDECIKLAGAVHLKVLLLLLRHGADKIGSDEIAEMLGMNRADAADAMKYWEQNGLLTEEGNENTAVKQKLFTPPPPAPEKQDVKPAPAPQTALPALPQVKPDSSQIAARCAESPELRYLYSEAQAKLGRTIGYDGQASLLMLHDTYGMPVEVILMVIGYCISIDKRSLNYVLKVGKDWAEKEIDTLELVEAHIEKLTRRGDIWSKFRSLTGITNPRSTASQQNYLTKWSEEWHFSVDMIYLAYEETVEHAGKISFAYMNSVLENWRNSGLTTPAMVMTAKQERKSKPAQSGTKSASGKKPSYDVNLFIKKAMQGAPDSKEDK